GDVDKSFSIDTEVLAYNCFGCGHLEQDRKYFWEKFLHEEDSVKKALGEVRTFALNAHENDNVLTMKVIEERHQEIGRKFRAALSSYPLSEGESSVFKIDRMLNGMDREFASLLEQITEDTEMDYLLVSARTIANQSNEIGDIQGRVELNLIVITVLILIEAILVLRTVNKSTTELNKLANESEKTVYHLAYSDPLTELPNRRLFQDRLEHAIALSNRTNQYRALMFLDMDNFKALNDTKGHAMGDLLLVEVAKRLKDSVRSSDTVARLGGDEFVVLLGELSEEEDFASEQALMIAEKVSTELARPFQLNDFEHKCSASIGVTMFCNAGMTIEEVQKRADAAMYQAKDAGRNTVRFFDPQTQAMLEARSELESELRMAIERNELQMYFQIQVDLDSKPIGAEALIRWIHPKMGMVFPGQFISMAEETGLILPIGQWVLESVCKQIKLWESNPIACELQIAVNVSAKQFHQDDFVTKVSETIKQTGINPSKLKLELTESVVLDDVGDTVNKMKTLKKHGVRFSMDDFGTGYSSLSYLTQLPLDQLKVDQSFVRNIGIKPTDAVIVQTIIGMATNLNIESIAEGVETQAQRDFLERAGCHLYQGFIYGKPVTVEKFTNALMEMGT
ncbi:MAG: EAL domain-containing protein, partial [Gallionella sp.]